MSKELKVASKIGEYTEFAPFIVEEVPVGSEVHLALTPLPGATIVEVDDDEIPEWYRQCCASIMGMDLEAFEQHFGRLAP